MSSSTEEIDAIDRGDLLFLTYQSRVRTHWYCVVLQRCFVGTGGGLLYGWKVFSSSGRSYMLLHTSLGGDDPLYTVDITKYSERRRGTDEGR